MATIIAIISLLVQAIKLSPEIVTLVKAIVSLLRMLWGKGFNVQGYIVRFREAIHVAREKKDTSQLEGLMRELVDHCHANGMCDLSEDPSDV